MPNEVVFISSTGIVGYSIIESIDQMKNALYFRGDVGVTLSSGLLSEGEYIMVSKFFYGDNFTWPSDDKDLHEEAFLGIGASGFTGGGHLVAVIGWGPCRVIPCNSNSSELIEAECWIGKYFLSFVAHVNYDAFSSLNFFFPAFSHVS
jgi:hypothetical protein